MRKVGYTDSNGTVVSSTDKSFAAVNYGLSVSLDSSGNGNLIWTLSSAVNDVGFAVQSYYSDNLVSATVSNGDTYGTSHTLGTNGYFGFSDSTTSFTSITLTFKGNGYDSFNVSDFKFGPATAAVPEPASLVNIALAGVVGVGALVYRRRRRTA